MSMKRIETLAVVQARATSSRLPRKVLREVNNRAILEWQVLRVLETKGVDQVVLATSAEQSDDDVAKIATRCGIPVIRGSLNNVFSRFIDVINEFDPKTVIRVTGDCPLYMPRLCESMLIDFKSRLVDYLSNTLKPSYPDGCDIEILHSKVLRKLELLPLTADELEHVTLGVYRRPEIFECVNFSNNRDDSVHRWTLDNKEDLDFIRQIYAQFVDHELKFSYEDIFNFLDKNPNSARYDDGTMRNSGLRNA